MKEAVISTEALNSYGGRVLTSGIDTTQYEKNPVLLWMHRRAFDEDDAMPIGRMENLRIDGDRLIGTPVFDEQDPFAVTIKNKWDNGFLRMLSAGLEIVATSGEQQYLVEGQTRETVTKSKLIEVSIVDIGSNDEAIQLYRDGRMLNLAHGEEDNVLPLLKTDETTTGEAYSNPEDNDNNKPNKTQMNKEQLELLGLAETATEEEATEALKLMKETACEVETMKLAAVAQTVDQAVSERRINADQRDHFIELGKKVGVDMLKTTFAGINPQKKPTDVINLSKQSAPSAEKEEKKAERLGEMSADERIELRRTNPKEYQRLFKAEYGVECPRLED